MGIKLFYRNTFKKTNNDVKMVLLGTWKLEKYLNMNKYPIKKMPYF